MIVTIRPVESADLDAFYDHQADPLATDMAKFPARDRAAHMAHWQHNVLSQPTGTARTVLVEGAVAGNLVSWRNDDGRRLVGYWIGREFWGRGVATQALRLFLNEVADRPLYAYVAMTNIGSARVLEKAGFVGSEESDVGSDGIEERLYVLE